VDSSASIGLENFQKVKNFLYTLVSSLHVNKYQIAFAQYSEEGQVEFLLNTYESKEDVLNHIRSNITFKGGPLHTGEALKFLHETYFTEEAGNRFKQGTPQFTVVVISDKSEDDVTDAAKVLKDAGIKVVTVGVLNSDQEEMERIATSPLTKSKSIPKDTIVHSASVADIVFLVDESSRIGQRNFHLIRTFLLKVISALDIGPDNVRVALVLYSDKPRLEFSLDTFEKKPEVLNYLTKLPYRGGQTYTGAAIDFVRKKVFSKKMGSRKDQGVQQLAVVITDGESLDNFTGPASKLRRKGVTVYAVGIQNVSASDQLYKIASHPPRKHVTNLGSFLQLSNIEWIIKKRLCNEIMTNFSLLASPFLGCEETEEADIYFLIDGSGSIYPDDFHDMKVFMNELISMFQVGTDRVRFGVVQYGSTPQTEFEIHQYNTVAQLKDAIKGIQQLGGGTRTGDALTYMQRLFNSSVRAQVPQFLIIITDGQSQDHGIVIYAIGVKSAVQSELEDIAGTKDRMFFVNDFDSLDLIKHDVVRDICSPEACKNLKADIILLIDTSKTMDQVQFELTKQFIELIVNKSDIGSEKIQIGLLQFSSDPQEEFPLNRYDNKADLRKAVSAMRQMKKGRKLGKALDFASPYFDLSTGGRPGAKQYLIVVTDGKSEDEVRNPARHLRNKGVTIYAIGVLQASNSQLLEIAGTQEKVFSEDFFEALLYLEKPILFEICNPEEECKRTEVADIVFVVHGSRYITELQFKGIQWLMESIVNDSVVGKDHVQFGVVVYSTDPQEEFPLNRFSTKLQVREAIQKLTLSRGFTFTARALNFARERFDAVYGGRMSVLGITRMIVLITDEPTTPTDRPNLPAAVQALRQAGIEIIAIGIDGASQTELQEIAGDSGNWFYNYIVSIYITELIFLSAACGTQEADLVFLIDGSGSISARNFSAMKAFMKEVVDSFIIAQDKVRIGVVQFSKDPQKEFYLNEFYTDIAIKGKIDEIVQLKTTTFTGKGLRFVRSFFEPENGGRKNKGVLQSLIVITDGKSNDSVDEAAIVLRKDGIQVFAIGIATPNSFELLHIAGDPRRVFVVENFEGLQNIERKIVSEICDPGDPPSQGI
uniref:VWFA domain-containing protein n=1 Tax=Anolis carolinensis TaxID=28377 RepID=A0A803SW48_ANOCA